MGDKERMEQYRKEILEMVEKIQSEKLLEFIKRFVARLLKNRGI